MMAIWQFDVLLVPSARAHELAQGSGRFPRRIVDSLFNDLGDSLEEPIETIDLWDGYTLPDGYEDSLGEFLTRAKGRDPEWQMFGVEDGTRIDVVFEDGKVDDVKARIDARTADISTLKHIADFAKSWDCVLVTFEGHVIEPDARSLAAVFRRSRAFQFALDPRGYIERLNTYEREQ